MTEASVIVVSISSSRTDLGLAYAVGGHCVGSTYPSNVAYCRTEEEISLSRPGLIWPAISTASTRAIRFMTHFSCAEMRGMLAEKYVVYNYSWKSLVTIKYI